MAEVTRTIVAENQYTDPISAGTMESNTFYQALNLSIYGAAIVAQVDVERSFDGGASWRIVESYTDESVERIIDEIEGDAMYRIGVATGNFTSGIIVCRLGRPD